MSGPLADLFDDPLGILLARSLDFLAADPPALPLSSSGSMPSDLAASLSVADAAAAAHLARFARISAAQPTSGVSSSAAFTALHSPAVPLGLRHLIALCLTPDPSRRPTAAALLSHPVFPPRLAPSAFVSHVPWLASAAFPVPAAASFGAADSKLRRVFFADVETCLF
jgi:serine/threonine protein kinase